MYHVRQRSLFDTFVSHPNSLKVRALGTHRGPLPRLLASGSHAGYVRLARCPCRAQKLVRTLIEGVVALNKVGIVHADIKPDNILLKYRVRARQSPRHKCAARATHSHTRQQLTHTHTHTLGVLEFVDRSGAERSEGCAQCEAH